VILELERPTEEIALITPPQKPQKPPPSSEKKQQAARKSGSSKKRGELAVTASVPNAEIYLDGKLLAVGNGVYSGIRSGKRTIRVVHDGFEPWEKRITITGGETARIEPQLATAEAPEPVLVSPEQHAAAGRKHLEARQYDLAMQQLSRAIEASPQPQFYAWRADAYVGMKKLREAEADFLSAVNLFAKANQDSRLDDLLSHAVLAVPGSPVLRMAYADYLYRHRRLVDAEKSYRRALDLGGDPVEAYIGIGLALYAGGSFDGAMQSWEQADDATGHSDPHLAGYLALANARLQYRASCRNAVRRLKDHPRVLEEFRGHPDWQRVRRLTGDG
jgi:Tfp pilus assembly protein PilF